jgi:hypothetical protein
MAYTSIPIFETMAQGLTLDWRGPGCQLDFNLADFWMQQSHDAEALRQAANATAFIKAGPNDKLFAGLLAKCLAEKTIGLGYDIHTDVSHIRDIDELKTTIDTHWDRRIAAGNHSGRKMLRGPSLINMLINKIQIGDKIIIGQGADKALYVATISSKCYYDKSFSYGKHHAWHRRGLTNIMALPQGTKVDTGRRPAITMRQPRGWGLC